MPGFDEYCEEIRDLWDSRWLTNKGAKHEKLREDLKRYLGISGVSLFANGHLALEAAISAFEFAPGSEVITTPFTFVSTVNAIKRCGLKPVFCDIDRSTYTLDPSKLDALITERTCAVLPVHVYGNICDTEEIDRIAKKHGLKVIYDAAHAFGVICNGKGVASFGDASMFSFHATKVFHTVEGGAVCYSDSELANKFGVIKNFGLNPKGDCVYTGGNAKMSEFHAAMGICNLRHIDSEIAKRKTAAERYRYRLSGKDGIILSPISDRATSNYAYMPVVFDGFTAERDQIRDKLKECSVLARKYFYPAVNEMCIYAEDSEKTPVAHDIASKVLCLPLYADLDTAAVDEICDIILSF